MSAEGQELQELRPVPADIQARIDAWKKLFITANYSYYFFGILAVSASAFSTATDPPISKYLSALSALCVAFLGFAQPDRKYTKFVRAWRVLDVAALRYRHHELQKTDLINAVETGEKIITSFEEDTNSPPRNTKTIGRLARRTPQS